jgi:hypothetical protein
MQLTAVRERLKMADNQTVKLQVRDTRQSVDSPLRDLGALWDGEPRIAREEVANNVGKITLKPRLRTYVATGVWNWLEYQDVRLLWWCRGHGMHGTAKGAV